MPRPDPSSVPVQARGEAPLSSRRWLARRPQGPTGRASREEPPRRGCGPRALGALGLLALALAGHLYYWYWPRERAAAPDPDDLPARVLHLAQERPAGAPSEVGAQGDGFDQALWVPYPHQNLGRLDAAVGDLDGYLEAAARRAGLSAPDLPRFGPLRLPPSEELAVAWDRSGDRLLVVARLYPVLAGVGRLAGKLADNPWLAGGPVLLGGRPARVEWRGTLWTVRTVEDGGSEDPGSLDRWVEPLGRGESPGGDPPSLEPALLWAQLSRPALPLPAGRYRLQRRGEALELAGVAWGAREGGGEETAGPLGLDLPRPEIPLVMARGPGAPAWKGSTPFRRRGAVAYLALPPGTVPRAVALAPPGVEPWDLPEAGLEELFVGLLQRREEVEERVAGIRLVASSEEDLEAMRRPAAELAREMAPLLVEAREGSGARGRERVPGGRLVVGLWFDPRPARGILEVSAGLLDDLPFLAATEPGRQLTDWQVLLAPIVDRESLTLVVTEDPGRVRLRLGPVRGEP